MFRNESLKAEIEIEVDRKDLGHIIHLLVVQGSFFFMSNACEMLRNKGLKLKLFSHFPKVTNYLSGCSQHCSLKLSPCIPVI